MLPLSIVYTGVVQKNTGKEVLLRCPELPIVPDVLVDLGQWWESISLEKAGSPVSGQEVRFVVLRRDRVGNCWIGSLCGAISSDFLRVNSCQLARRQSTFELFSMRGAVWDLGNGCYGISPAELSPEIFAMGVENARNILVDCIGEDQATGLVRVYPTRLPPAGHLVESAVILHRWIYIHKKHQKLHIKFGVRTESGVLAVISANPLAILDESLVVGASTKVVFSEKEEGNRKEKRSFKLELPVGFPETLPVVGDSLEAIAIHGMPYGVFVRTRGGHLGLLHKSRIKPSVDADISSLIGPGDRILCDVVADDRSKLGFSLSFNCHLEKSRLPEFSEIFKDPTIHGNFCM